MHEFIVDPRRLNKVVREAVCQALEAVMEAEHEVFLANTEGRRTGTILEIWIPSMAALSRPI
ncbi:MAG: hypothetical protein KM310_00620 [Clostridiales bacterium]|nr:hypothetical protein [Clostridiales bacterium]